MTLRHWCLRAALLLALAVPMLPLPAGAQQMSVTPVVTNGAYASGNSLGGLVSFTVSTPVSATGILQSFAANSQGGATPALDIFLFNANPTGTTCTDKTNFALGAADDVKIIGVAQITSYIAAGTPTQGQAPQLAMTYLMGSGQTLWACVVTRSIFTPATTSDITYIISVLP